MSINAKLPDPPKAADWVRHLPGLIPFALALTAVVIFAVIVPGWLKQRAVDDLRGVPEHTSTGVVQSLQEDPGHLGGGGIFNAVVIEVDRHRVFWDLPSTSLWRPKIGEVVEVHYRVGRLSGHVVHIDDVQWGPLMDVKYRQP